MTTSADHVLALDVGGTKLAAAVVTSDGTVHPHRTVPTPSVAAGADRGATVWAGLAAVVAAVLAEPRPGRLLGVGIGSAGPVHLPTGAVSPVNIPTWRGFPLVDHVRSLVPGVPVVLAGDGICAAIGEHWAGAGRGVDDLLVLVVSTGVGGGLVLGGRVLHGPSGNAGHVGHLVVEPDGPPCPCGGRGCLEAIASGRRLHAWAVAQGWRPAPDEPDDARGVAVAATRGHEAARAAFTRAGRAVGVAVASVAATCDIRVALVGGGVANAGDLLLTPAREALAEHAHLPFLDGVRLDTAGLGGTAGLAGAAALVLDPHRYAPRGAVGHRS